MPILRVPNVISYYTEKQTQFEVSGFTALEAVQSAVRIAAVIHAAACVHEDEGSGNRHLERAA